MWRNWISPIISVAGRCPGIRAIHRRLRIDIGSAVAIPFPVKGHPALSGPCAIVTVVWVTGPFRINEKRIVKFSESISGKSQLRLMIGNFRVCRWPEKVGRGYIQFKNARVFLCLCRGRWRQTERLGNPKMRFVFSGTMAVRFFEIFADVIVCASWTAALYSVCGSILAELSLLQEERVRHETAKSNMIKYTGSGEVLKRKVFIFPPAF